MRVFIMRHGETDYNTEGRLQGTMDIELNENGRLQALRAAEKLKETGITLNKVYSSRLKRAAETAEIIASGFGVENIVVNGLEERNLGVWQGQKYTELKNLFAEDYYDGCSEQRGYIIKGGETCDQLLSRGIKAVKHILSQSDKDDCILILSHGVMIMALLTFAREPDFKVLSADLLPENLDLHEFDDNELSRITLAEI